MKLGDVREVTGEFARESVEWLREMQEGCCSICFAADDRYNYAVCIGWHNTGPDRIPQPDGTWKDVPGDDGWRIAWKIGRQTHDNVMQCDFDVDFEMPYDTDTGDVDDTCEVIETDGRRPAGYRSWDRLASYMRKTARRVWRDWKEIADEGS